MNGLDFRPLKPHLEVMSHTLIVIGGNTAGLAAALAARRSDPALRVQVLEATGDVSWGACGIPYNLGDEGREVEDLRVREPVRLREAGIELLLGHRVEGLDLENRRLEGTRSQSAALLPADPGWEDGATIRLDWDRLVVASGATVRPLAIPGLPPGSLRTVKTLEDVRRLKQELPAARRVLICGAGPVGLEMTDVLLDAGVEVCLVDPEPLPLPGFHGELRRRLANRLESAGVHLRPGCLAESVQPLRRGGGRDTFRVRFRAAGSGASAGSQDGRSKVRNEDAREAAAFSTPASTEPLPEWDADLVLNCTGILPAADFARRAGLAVEGNGALIVNERMQTSHPDVFAAGDCAIREGAVSAPGGAPVRVYNPQALEALRGGRVAGHNAAQQDERNRRSLAPSPGTLILRCCGFELARCGILSGEEASAEETPLPSTGGLLGQARPAGSSGADRSPGVLRTHVVSRTRGHAMAGAGVLEVVLEAERGTGRLLGGAVLAEGEGALRIDVLAALLQRSARVHELAELDLAYSPPFGPARDPLLVAADRLLRRLEG